VRRRERRLTSDPFFFDQRARAGCTYRCAHPRSRRDPDDDDKRASEDLEARRLPSLAFAPLRKTHYYFSLLFDGALEETEAPCVANERPEQVAEQLALRRRLGEALESVAQPVRRAQLELR
jgi:hypothetical protein